MSKRIKNHIIMNFALKFKKLNVLKNLIILFLFLSLNSCSDSGCIEADDFGEYDTKSIKVYSNNADGLCKYNAALNYNDPNQPQLLKGCITLDNCSGKSTETEKESCAKLCEAKCKNNPALQKSYATQANFNIPSGTSLSEPPWIEVGDDNFKIYENTRILVSANGEIEMGEKGGDNLELLKIDLVDKLFDDKTKYLRISANDQMSLRISADFGIDTSGASSASFENYFDNPSFNNYSSQETATTITELKNNEIKFKHPQIANGSKRLFAYFISSPSIPAISDDNLIPILPDPAKSSCDLEINTNWLGTGTSRYTKAKCSNDDNNKPDKYILSSQSADYENDNKLISNSFKMDNYPANQQNIKYNDSGFILRFDEENLFSLNHQLENRAFISNISNNLMADTISSSLSPPNKYIDYEIRLVLSPINIGSSDCQDYFQNANTKPRYKILNENEQSPADSSSFQPMMNETDPEVLNNFNLPSNAKFTYKSFILKSGQKILIEKKDISGNDPKNLSCNFELFFYPYFSIKNTISGIVEMGHIYYYSLRVGGDFVNVDGTNSSQSTFSNLSNCNMSINIKNPDGTYEFSNNQTYEFNNNNIGNKQIYLRKGQELLIKPDIWNKYYTLQSSGETYNINCGVGFYIKKEPKPAVLCHKQKIIKINVNEDYNSSNNCKNLLIDNNIIQGCSINYDECSNFKDSSGTINTKFCPTECLPLEEDFKQTTCKPSIVNGAFTSATNCPDISSITNFDFQTVTPATNPASLKTEYNKINIKCAQTCPSNSDSICKNFSSFYTSSSSKYYSVYNPLTAPEKTNFMTFDKCKACLDSSLSKIKTDFFPENSTNLDLCYDLENYTGSILDFYTKSPSTVDRMEVTDLKNKGLQYLSPFVNNYGNFYPLINSEGTSPWTLKNYYQTKNSTFFTSNGYLKFTLISNPIDIFSSTTPPSQSNINIDFINNIFYNSTNNSNLIKDSSIVQIIPSYSTKFSSGQKLSILPCYNDGSGKCSGYSSSSEIIRTNPIASSNIDLIPKIVSFDEATGLIDPTNNYSFNEFGNLTRITNQIDGDCSGLYQPYNGANFLCLNNQGALNDNRLSFKIIDNEKPNCKLSDGTDCSIGSDCNGVKAINLNWDGSTSGNCDEATAACVKKYYCANKYFNNSGKYDVKIRVMNPEKTKTSNLINSIISPVMEEIDGFSKEKDENLQLLSEASIYNKFYKQYPTPNIRTVNLDTVFTTDNLFNNSGDLIEDSQRYDFNQNDIQGGKIVNVNIPKNTSVNCTKGNGCVIAYIGGFFGDMVDASNIDANKVDITNSNCFSSNANLRSKLFQCVGKISCSLTLKSLDGNQNRLINDIGYITVNQRSPTNFLDSPQICNKSLHVFVAYKLASSPLEKTNQAKRIYNNITNNPIFKSTLTLSMVLMISFYGLGFLMGVSEFKQSEIMSRLVKMGLIYLFTSPNAGWIFFEKFFVSFFKEGADYLTFLMASIFSDGEKINEALLTNNFSDKSPLFESVDKVLGLYLINDIVHKKITALLFYNFVGILYCVILYYCAITYVYAVSNAVLLYLTAQFFTTVLFVIGPFFFIFLLFKQTKTFFDNWLNSLIGFALQQIFVIFTLNIFNTIIYMATKMALSYRVCWDNIWNINSFGFNMSLFSYWTIQDAPPYINEVNKINVNGEYKNTSPSLTMVLLTWSMVTIMRSFLSTISDLAAQLSGGIQASSLGTGVSAGVNKAIGAVKKIGSKAFDKVGGNKLIRTVDKDVFGSGKDAKIERKKKREQNKSDIKDIAQMAKAGDDAVTKYKQENTADFAKMSEADKKKTLIDVKKNAMTEYAKGSGKSQKDIDRLMNLRGFKGNSGDNIFGAGINLIRSSGTLRASLSDKVLAVDTGFSGKEIKGAMANMDEDQRKGFMENLKSGEIQKKGGNVANTSLASARETAIKQLEESGKIDKKSNILNSSTIQSGLRAIGGEQKRSVNDENLIQEQMKKNAINSSVDKGSNFSAREIDKYEKLAKYQDAKEIGDKDGMKEARKEYKEAKLNAKIEGKTSKSARSESQKDASKKRIEKSKKDNENNIKQNKKEQENKEAEIAKANDNINSNPAHREMDELNSKIKEGKASDEDKSKFNKMVIDDNENSQKTGEQSYKEKDSIRSNLKEDLTELKEKGENFKKIGNILGNE